MHVTNRTIKYLLLSFFVLFIFFSCSDSDNDNDNSKENLEIHFINVGQGDCTLIIAPNGKTLLVDAGRANMGNSVVAPYLKSLGIDSLQYAIVTHYHSDHYGGMARVLSEDNVPISRYLYDRGDDGYWYSYMDVVGSRRRTLLAGDEIDLDNDISIECVASGGNGFDLSENDMSVAIVLHYGSFDFFVGGDLESTMENLIAEYVGTVEILQLNHHGSSTSSTYRFLSALDPICAIASCSPPEYGHPHSEVVSRLESLGIDIYKTNDDCGNPFHNNIVVQTNGKYFSIESDKVRYIYNLW